VSQSQCGWCLELIRTCALQLAIGAAFLAFGAVMTLAVCACCWCFVKMARGWNSSAGMRPDNAVGGAMYDVHSRYGHWLPGMVAGQPVHPNPGNGSGYQEPQYQQQGHPACLNGMLDTNATDPGLHVSPLCGVHRQQSYVAADLQSSL
jgi:hypothetical protein